MTKRAATARVVAVVLAALCMAAPAAAQTQVFGMSVEGDVEVGGRIYGERPSKSSSAKFEEYRDLPERPFLDRLQLRFFRPDESYSVELGGSKGGQEDQEYFLRSGRLGLWEFGFDWDQMRHVFSTNARMLSEEASPGVFRLPSGLARAFPADGPLYNAARELDEISTRWDTARMSFRLTPTPDIDFKAEYTRIDKSGERPMGIAFGFNLLEVLEPIDQTVDDVTLRLAIAKDRWQLQFGYTFSMFRNDVDRLFAENPFRATDIATASASGQVALPPSNMAHTFSLAGGVNLPWWRTRLTGNLSYSVRLQNDDFLPHTVNTVINAASDLRLPQKSLNGHVDIFLLNLNATSRPLPPLTLSAKYRLYDFVDSSDVITFPNVVEADRLVEGPHRASRADYRKHNLDVDARWRIVRPVAFTLGTGWERWERSEFREVSESDEFFGKTVLDVTPVDWLLVRAKYMPSIRRINGYDTDAPAKGKFTEEVVHEEASIAQSVLLRKLDEAERDRHRLDLLVQLTPIDTLTLTQTAGYRHDDFPDTVLGLQREISWSAGMDVNWTPVERLSLTAGYMHESFFQKQRARYRPVTGGVGFDYADFDWISINTDTIETVHAGVKAALIPRVLDWTLRGNFSTAMARMETRNPVAPVSGTAPQNASAKTKPNPALVDSLLRLETSLRYHFLKSWTAGLSYIFESFDKDDWRTDTLTPYIVGLNNAVFLGNDQKDYDAHIVVLTLGYRFE